MRFRSLLLSISAALLPGCSSQAQDWPMWGGTPSRNMVSPGKDSPTEWDLDKQTNVKWTSTLGSTSHGNPVVAGGVIYLGTNNESHRDPTMVADAGVLMAFRESDGAFLWQRASAKLPAGRVNDWPGQGICCSPCVDSVSQRLWYCTNRCEVVCLNLRNRGLIEKTPRVVWSLDMMKDLGVFPHNMTNCSPVVWGSFVYVITANGVDDTHKNVVAPAAPAIVCINKDTGQVVWTDNSPGDRVLHGQWASPCVAQIANEDVVIAPLGDGWVYGYQAQTGKILWKFDTNAKDAIYPQTRNELLATPVVFENRLYIANGQDPEHGEGPGTLWCVDLTKRGDISAELPLPPATQPAELLAPPKDRPRAAANPNSGVVWKFSAIGPDAGADNRKLHTDHRMNRTISTVAIDPSTGLLFIPDFAGFMHCLDARNGKHQWTHDLESPTWGSALVCDGKIYHCTEDGFVRIFASSREKKLIGEHDMGSPFYSTPVYANGVLYLMTRDKLFAIAKPER